VLISGLRMSSLVQSKCFEEVQSPERAVTYHGMTAGGRARR